MLFDLPLEDHVVGEYRVKPASEPWEVRDAYALRRAVFCHEQGVFAGDDRDAIDERCTLLVAVSCIAGVPDQVVGTVRIHRQSPSPAARGAEAGFREAQLRAGGAGRACQRATIAGVGAHGLEPSAWWGSRLAVHPSFRRIRHIGAALIRLAVSTAHARGCAAFFAHVQSQNAPLFERLHWRTLDQVVLHGRPHHHMQADLAFYPPLADCREELVLVGAD